MKRPQANQTLSENIHLFLRRPSAPRQLVRPETGRAKSLGDTIHVQQGTSPTTADVVISHLTSPLTLAAAVATAYVAYSRRPPLLPKLRRPSIRQSLSARVPRV